MLSTEQGVYIAEFVSGNNQKQAKGRYRVYENDNGSVNVSISLCFPSSHFDSCNIQGALFTMCSGQCHQSYSQARVFNNGKERCDEINKKGWQVIVLVC